MKTQTAKPLTITYVLALSAALHRQSEQSYNLEGQSAQTFNVRFREADTAVVGIIKPGNSTLKVSVYAPSGRPVFAKEVSGDNVLITYLDNEQGAFIIRVENRSPVSCRYILGANASLVK